MDKLLAQSSPLTDNEALWAGMDAVGIGLFVINRDGYLIRYNDAAGHIFGIMDDTHWGDHHLSSVDSIMSLGLTEKVNDVIDGSERLFLKGVNCTNANGDYHVVDIYCCAAEVPDGDTTMLGIIRDADSPQPTQSEFSDPFQELQILSTVAASLSSSCELEQILEVILTGATASQGLGFNRAFLFLYDPDTNCLNGHLAIGPASAEEAGHIWRELEAKNLSLNELLDAEKRHAVPPSSPINHLIHGLKLELDKESLISQACAKGAWINSETTQNIDPITMSFLDHLGTRDMALVPMISKDNLLGMLAADCAITQRPISNASVQLLQILANQAAVAMERARLYEEQITRATQLEDMNRLLGESQDHIIKIEKMSIIGELTAAIAHELRNPLAVIGGFANLMLKSEVTDEQREYLNIIANETVRSETVLAQVLDFHEASKGSRQEINFAELVQKNLQLAKGRLRRPDIEISLSLSAQDLMIYGNYDQLSHAIYQFFRLVVEDLIPPGSAEVRTEQIDNRAVMLIKINVSGQDREKTVKAIKQIFADNKTSQRLTILVAGETLRYHGGNFGVRCEKDAAPSLFVELPLSKER